METNQRASKIAWLSFTLSGIRSLSGPVTLLILSFKLSSELLGFYYAFYSVVAFKALFEAGVSNVIKLHLSHLNDFDKKERSNLFLFSIVWMLFISMISGGVIYFLGNLYFSNYNGVIAWKEPWLFLCITSSVLLFLSVIEIYLDGSQYQILLKKVQLISSLSVLFLWASFLFDYGLYSMAVMQFVNVIFLLSAVWFNRSLFIDVFQNVKDFSFFYELNKIRSLLFKVSLVWISGYFFWNGFNLLSFKLFSPEVAGKIGLSLAIAKAGYSIATSLLVNQTTLIADCFSRKINPWRIFRKYFLIGWMLLLFGYSSFLIIIYNVNDIFIVKKLLPFNELIYLFGMFLVIKSYVSMNNYIRAKKIEPFVVFSYVNSLLTITAFYIGINLEYPLFLLPLLSSLIMLSYSVLIFKRLNKANYH